MEAGSVGGTGRLRRGDGSESNWGLAGSSE